MGVVVTLEGERGQQRSALDQLAALVAADLGRVNETILRLMTSEVPLIPELAGHLIASGGKRLRPMLLLAAARLCGYRGERHIKLAACVEFIHTATLLHDDVVDASEMRRGQSTANMVWGNSASVLVGDFLFTRSFQLMVEDGSLAVLAILSNASRVIAEGEVMQLMTTADTSTSEDAYLKVIASKTAALFSAACRVGAVVAERPRVEEDALEAYGRNLGIAFQLVDDALDYAARQASLGKTIGDDFREGKMTLPVVLAFRRGTDEERAFWRRALEQGEQDDGALAHAMALLGKYNAIRDTVERARHYGAVARDALAIFPDSEMKQILSDTVEFVIERGY
ncbi:polyprenyl synthetase family protein [Zavarzinia sp. CC-PAN008]|uniref:polyprenyl synthetase family protein n=1 Tax=Zavarzinia sp. CC-PAN008 TaxID=3243332 RepID=UPI003F745A34